MMFSTVISQVTASTIKRAISPRLLKYPNVISIGVIADPNNKQSHALSIGVLCQQQFLRDFPEYANLASGSGMIREVPTYIEQTELPKALGSSFCQVYQCDGQEKNLGNNLNNYPNNNVLR